MKKTLLFIGTVLMSMTSFAQNPGLVLSEILANPSGSNDSPFEWIELVATSTIDFTATPYTVVCNNSAATVNGWIEGGTISYAFQINSGIVHRGDVVYVGGSSMAPTGTKLRVINTATTGGDGFGSAATGGVVGNGGGNGDGIAVFNLPVASITPSSVPVDALFYGTGLGSAVLNGGADGYQLPANDRYSGGKLQSTSYFAGDPAGDQTIRAVGAFNTQTNTWATTRTWTVITPTLDNLSSLSLLPGPGTITFSAVTQNAAENAGTVNIGITAASANAYPAKVILSYSVYTDATEGVDFTLSEDTIVIPANFNGTQNVPLTIIDDALAERTEKVILKMRSLENATIGTNSFHILYIQDNDYQAPAPNNELKLNLLTSFSNGARGTNSAEIVSFDPTTDKLYIANSIGKKMDIVDFTNPATPVLLNSISIVPYGNINSLTVHNGVVACAVENTAPQSNGHIVFFDEGGTFISQVEVGAMPDMITFNNDYTKILAACEGEPNADYSIDPEGSIAIIDITGGYASLTAANVTLANFQAFNGQEVALRTQGIRIFGPGANAAKDFEPEYITISEDNSTAYVSLQENNAMAVVDIATGTVTAVRPLGSMNYANGNNGLDASDQTTGILIGSAPIKGLFMPDALAHATIGGTEYIFSANEGDAREYSTALVEATRLSGATLDASIPDQNILKHNRFLGRIDVSKASGDTDNDGDIDDIHVFGTRSFSIWNAQTGALVYDSKDLFEQITAADPAMAGMFNASNDTLAIAAKNRSDNKGPEPEGVAAAVINGNNYLFVSLERIGGVMVFNVDVPTAPTFVGYYNNRTLLGSGPDLGAEGIITISKEDSPSGKEIVILANEVSSTLSIYEINTCVDLAGAAITVPTDSICAGSEVTLTIPGNAQSTVQWLKDNQVIAGETGNSLAVTEAGNYRIYVSNSTLACADTTLAEAITVLALPTIDAGSDVTICIGDTVNLTAVSAAAISWNNGIQDGVDFFPTDTMDYVATATDNYGCEHSDTLTVTVNSLPAVNAGIDTAVCAGTSVTFAATGAATYSWNNGITNGTSFDATIAGSYIVTGTDANGCINSDTLALTLHALPSVNLGADRTVCANHFPVSLNGPAGFSSYLWSNGTTTQNTSATEAGTFVLTVTNNDGCKDTDTIAITSDPCLSLAENSVLEYSMYPNPASNSVFVETNAPNSEVVIYAANGQVLFTQRNTAAAFELDLTDLADGLYWVTISSGEGTATKQLLIKK
ncbi:hypothetical protein D3C87_63260 [compost metagenome]